MQRARPPDEEPNRKSGFMSWRGAIATWIVISFVGWIVLAALFFVLSPEQASQVATDKDAKGLSNVAPAAGPAKKPEK